MEITKQVIIMNIFNYFFSTNNLHPYQPLQETTNNTDPSDPSLISTLDFWIKALDHDKLYPFQEKADRLASKMQILFTPFTQFDEWARKNPTGSWYIQISSILCKLPAAVACNVIYSLYATVETAAKLSIHPKKTSLELSKNFLRLLSSLGEVSNWANMNAGFLGANAAHLMISGSGLTSHTLLALAATTMIFGFGIGIWQKCLNETNEENYCPILITETRHLLEAFATGMAFGSIMSALRGNKTISHKPAQKHYHVLPPNFEKFPRPSHELPPSHHRTHIGWQIPNLGLEPTPALSPT